MNTEQTSENICKYDKKSREKKNENLETAHIKNNDTLFSAFHDTFKARVFTNIGIPLRIYLLYKIISPLR